ncbi:hypothetical protein BDF20DRAFT_651428 [Mycotypha africana]|uniref:uncharacterized protein n=1 Tax=Mycotypha africana TaxID=64632 RepID=UPI0022FFD729|nr:uncharacterized protein BDF20DRAFT_651428 [Mycotypha africana]KAI8973433.1 hypothetical protein BDF20DRAFT_651428 [Mycotypha africana]
MLYVYKRIWTKTESRDILGVRDLRLVHTLLQVIVSWGLYPCFLPGVGVPLSKRVKSGYINHELLTAEEDGHEDKRRTPSTIHHTNKQQTLLRLVTPLVDMIASSDKVPDSKQYTTVASILLNRHLPDLYAALLQLAYAPNSAFNKSNTSSSSTDTPPTTITTATTTTTTTTTTNSQPTHNVPMTPGNMMAIKSVNATITRSTAATATTSYLSKEERDKCARMFMWLFEKSDLVRSMESLMGLLRSDSSSSNSESQRASSVTEPVPNWLRTISGRFLSRILLKPNGVSVILNFIIGDVEQLQLSQLESISKLILSVPQQMPSIESYYAVITPQLLHILQNEPIASPMCQAVIFIVGRMVAKYPELAKKYIIDKIVGPLLSIWEQQPLPSEPTDDNDGDDEIKITEAELVNMLHILHRILMGGEPGVITQTLLSSSIHVLYHLYQFTCQSKSSLKEVVLDLLSTYFRITTTSDAIHELKRILLDSADVSGTRLAYFAPGPTIGGGVVVRVRRKPKLLAGNELPIDASILVEFLQKSENEDLCGDFFVFLLNEYSSLKTRQSSDPRIILMILHLIMGMLDTLGPAILNKPTQIISFANNVIQDHADKLDIHHKTATEEQKKQKKVSGFPDMLSNIVSQEEFEAMNEDHDEQLSTEDDEESLILAINLLRAVMHGNDNLNEKAVQLLKSSMEPLKVIEKQHPFELVSEAVNELLLALTSFLSSESISKATTSNSSSLEASKEKYKLAMKSLQDELLPIRAHGMGLLKEMALAKDPLVSSGEGLDHLLDIFTRLVQDEDSYIYLNAVKGLSAMTDAYGNEIIKKLGEVYTNKQQKLDNRLRIGEALLQTIQRCGDALGKYAHTLLEPLETVLGRRDEDSHLRVSALSILGMACQTCPVALSAHMNGLIDWVLNILEIEKVPEVRRAATVLILSLFRGLAAQTLYEYPTESLRRTYRTLRYIEETDADELCRYQARVALSDLDDIMRGEIFKHPQSASLNVRYK